MVSSSAYGPKFQLYFQERADENIGVICVMRMLDSRR